MVIAEHPSRRFRLVVVLIMLVTGVGVPLAFRAVSPSRDTGFLPAVPGLVQMGLGAALIVVGSLVLVRTTARASPGSHPDHGPVRLPRPVGRAVRRRREIPPEYRDQVPVWLHHQRILCAGAAGPIVWGPSTVLVLTAGDTVRSLLFGVATAVVMWLVLGGVAGTYAIVISRARRHYATTATFPLRD